MSEIYLSDPFIALFLGLEGLAVGSFLRLLIDRLPRGESIIRGASHCEACHTRLGIRDLVPVFSYVWSRGRCRHCGAKIPVSLPLVELFTGLVFAYIGYEYGWSVDMVLLMIYSGFLIIIFMVDLEQGLILNRVVFPAIVLAGGLSPVRPDNTSDGVLEVFLRSLLGGAIALVIMLAIYLLFRGGMGEGDVKLAPFIGLLIGFPVVLITLLMSALGGGLIAALLILTKLRRRKDRIPFGPFLALSALVSLFWGQDLWDWYSDLFSS